MPDFAELKRRIWTHGYKCQFCGLGSPWFFAKERGWLLFRGDTLCPTHWEERLIQAEIQARANLEAQLEAEPGNAVLDNNIMWLLEIPAPLQGDMNAVVVRQMIQKTVNYVGAKYPSLKNWNAHADPKQVHVTCEAPSSLNGAVVVRDGNEMWSACCRAARV